MAKRKKDDEVPSELPKRIKSFLETSKTADPAYRVRESERIVDEILKSPVVVARVV